MSNKQKAKKHLEKSLERDLREIRDGSRKEVSSVCQRYLKAIVDTRNAPKVGVPTNIGGHPGQTAIQRFTQQLEVVTGSGSLGFCAVQPSYTRGLVSGQSGPWQSGNQMWYSNATSFAGATPLPLPLNTPPLGTAIAGWSQSPYRRSATTQSSDLMWRIVGCTITVTPTSSFSDQNGRIVLLEAPSHVPLNDTGGAGFDLAAAESFPTARVLRAVQTGAQSEKIVLNWHPKSSAFSNTRNDFDFNYIEPGQPSATQTPGLNGLMVVFHAKSGTAFHCEVTCMYEMKGKMVPGVKPRLTDSRGMDLIQNTLARKLISGYVGKPEHVYESYLSQAWTMARKTGRWIKEHERELMDGAGKALGTIAGFI